MSSGNETLVKEISVLNIASTSRDWRSRKLHNAYLAGFMLEGRHFRSVAHFIEMIKYPEDVEWYGLNAEHVVIDFMKQTVSICDDEDGAPRRIAYNPVVVGKKRRLDRREILKLCDPKVLKRLDFRPGKLCVHFCGKTYPYRSPEHLELIRRAMEAKFAQNKLPLIALLATEGIPLEYIPKGKPSLTVTPAFICQTLTDIRERALEKTRKERCVSEN